jgi:hypothetical protein
MYHKALINASALHRIATAAVDDQSVLNFKTNEVKLARDVCRQVTPPIYFFSTRDFGLRFLSYPLCLVLRLSWRSKLIASIVFWIRLASRRSLCL